MTDAVVGTQDAEASMPSAIRRDGAPISLAAISHAFGEGERGVIVLDNVSLEIPAGQFVALVGPSGCGKTTLLNMIAGMLKPLSGTVQIGKDVVTRPTRHTGYMLARDGLLPWRSARANVELGLDVRRVRRSQRKLIATDALRMVDLEGFEQAYPRELSQGMRQRVAIARTLAMDPDVLLMDEPYAALDAQTRIGVQAEFTRIWEKTGKTVVFVTHDLSEAVLLADRVIVLAARPGRIIDDIEIDLPRPRNVEELRFSDHYQSLHEKVWLALRESQQHA